jgi:hypothetical protein
MSLRLEPGNIVTMIFGLFFIGAGIYIYMYMGRYLETAQAAPGVVVSVVHASEGTTKGRRHPVVRFTTVDGNEVVATAQQHHNVQPGQTVQVLYDPAHPERIEIGTLSQVHNQRIFFTALCVLFGLGVSAAGLGVDLKLLKRRLAAYRR